MEAVNRFFYEIHKANKQFALEQWDKWQEYLSETLKADVEKKYPDGFKDFLVEAFDRVIKENKPKNSNVKKEN